MRSLPDDGATINTSWQVRTTGPIRFPFLTSPELPQATGTAVQTSYHPIDGGFTPELPTNHIRDVESSEFCELHKLLPKNLNSSHIGSDYPDTFHSIRFWYIYMLIVVQKFPKGLQDYSKTWKLLGMRQNAWWLGWCIYDHNLHQFSYNVLGHHRQPTVVQELVGSPILLLKWHTLVL